LTIFLLEYPSISGRNGSGSLKGLLAVLVMKYSQKSAGKKPGDLKIPFGNIPYEM